MKEQRKQNLKSSGKRMPSEKYYACRSSNSLHSRLNESNLNDTIPISCNESINIITVNSKKAAAETKKKKNLNNSSSRKNDLQVKPQRLSSINSAKAKLSNVMNETNKMMNNTFDSANLNTEADEPDERVTES